MKIYPSQHEIEKVSEINLDTDVVLAYIDTNHKEYQVSVTSTLPYKDKAVEVLPYQVFDTYDVKLFKQAGQPTPGQENMYDHYTEIDNGQVLKREDDKYIFMPSGSVSFIPQRFSYSIIGKKKLTYKTNKTYNLKIGCSDEELSKQIIKLFGTAPEQKICPSNIWVNNKDISHMSLINQTMDNMDFMFINSDNGQNYRLTRESIDKDIFLDRSINTWIISDKLPYTSIEGTTQMNQTALYNKAEINNSLFLASSIPNKDGAIIHHIFSGSATPAAIYEYKGRGFEIVTKKSLFDNIEQNIKVIYEILFYVYKLSYKKTTPIVDWIADSVPDYIMVDGKLTVKDKFMSTKKIHELFSLNIDEVDFVNVLIDKSNVVVDKFVNNYIVFKKLYKDNYAEFADPEKPAGSKSIYTARQDIVYFDNFVYMIEENIEKCISYARNDNSYDIAISGFKHSSGNINLLNNGLNKINVPLTIVSNYVEEVVEKIDIAVCINNGLVQFVDMTEYNEWYGTRICVVTIERVLGDTQIFDMRTRGGGIPDGNKGNYSLLDIGHVNGLAYRKAGALIITLPSRLKEHKELIEKTIIKHMTSEKYPIILFEGE